MHAALQTGCERTDRAAPSAIRAPEGRAKAWIVYARRISGLAWAATACGGAPSVDGSVEKKGPLPVRWPPRFTPPGRLTPPAPYNRAQKEVDIDVRPISMHAFDIKLTLLFYPCLSAALPI